MTICCPHQRLRLAASLAPQQGQAATEYATDLLARAVRAFDDCEVDSAHAQLLATARRIVDGRATTELWAALSTDLIVLLPTRPVWIGIDLAREPSTPGEFWWDKGGME